MPKIPAFHPSCSVLYSVKKNKVFGSYSVEVTVSSRGPFALLSSSGVKNPQYSLLCIFLPVIIPCRFLNLICKCQEYLSFPVSNIAAPKSRKMSICIPPVILIRVIVRELYFPLNSLLHSLIHFKLIMTH